MKEKSFRSYILPVVLVVVLLVPHLLFFDNGYVDIEPVYIDAASRIAEDGLDADLTDYYAIDANPILTSLIFAAGYKLFPESPFVSRLTIFLLAFAFVLFLFYYLRNKIGPLASFLAALLISVNPMFIIYSQYIASDVSFMLFSSVAFLFLIYPYSSKANIASAIMFGVSTATKYAVIVLMPVVFLISLMNSRILKHFSKASLFSSLRFNIWYFALAFLVAAPIIVIVFCFQSSLLPPIDVRPISLSVGMFIPRFLSYLMWLGLFVGPSCLVFGLSLWRRIGKAKFLMVMVGLVALTSVVSLFFPPSSLVVEQEPLGAASLGWVPSAVPPLILSLALFFVLLVAELFIVHAIIDIIHVWSSEDEPIKNVLFWGLVPIPLMAANRVCSRYLLFVLVPVSLYMAHVMGRMYSERSTRPFVLAVLIMHAVIFLAVGFYSNYYLYLRGLAG